MNKIIKTKASELHQEKTGSQEELTDEDIEKYKNEIRNERYISEPQSLDDLYFKIKNNNIEVEASEGRVFKSDELIKLISEVAGEEKTINHITRSCGLRKKVKELIEIEAIKNKLPE